MGTLSARPGGTPKTSLVRAWPLGQAEGVPVGAGGQPLRP